MLTRWLMRLKLKRAEKRLQKLASAILVLKTLAPQGEPLERTLLKYVHLSTRNPEMATAAALKSIELAKSLYDLSVYYVGSVQTLVTATEDSAIFGLGTIEERHAKLVEANRNFFRSIASWENNLDNTFASEVGNTIAHAYMQ